LEEPREQHKVAEVHSDREFDIEWRDVTVLVARTQELVGVDVDEAAGHHLGELAGRDDHGYLAGGRVPQGAESVIRVHNGVHAVVHHDEPAGGRRVLGVRVPRVQQYRNVMVPMQEDERLLPQHYEHCVSQLWQLRQHEHPRPEPGHAVILNKTETHQPNRAAVKKLDTCSPPAYKSNIFRSCTVNVK